MKSLFDILAWIAALMLTTAIVFGLIIAAIFPYVLGIVCGGIILHLIGIIP